jgi:anaerobic nitric oxide reductase transcription regulator
VAPLVGHFVDQTRSQLGAGKVRVTETFLERLQQHDFPGNVRELENLVSRAVLRAASRAAEGSPVIVELGDLATDLSSQSNAGFVAPKPQSGLPRPGRHFEGSLREAVDRYQRELIEHAVSQCSGNWSQAAQLLQLNRANLHHLAVRLGLK